jgi:methyltransferase (TIGR00027 family)
MGKPLIENVSDTAFMVAVYRATETARPDALFHDLLADRLAGDHGRRIVASLRSSFLGPWSVVVRTCIIDDFIVTALAQGVDTILNLGAGLDTRPYRMTLPGSLRWIEVDYPHLIELKNDRLADERPRCQLERVKLDLADVTARHELLSTINSRSTTALVLTEGVVPYLRVEDVASLARDLKSHDAFRFWIVDYLSAAAIRYRKRHSFGRKIKNAPFRFEPGDWFSFFEKHGWKAAEVRYLVDEGERFNRPIPLPGLLRLCLKAFSLVASPERIQTLRRSAGYVRLEPL